MHVCMHKGLETHRLWSSNFGGCVRGEEDSSSKAIPHCNACLHAQRTGNSPHCGHPIFGGCTYVRVDSSSRAIAMLIHTNGCKLTCCGDPISGLSRCIKSREYCRYINCLKFQGIWCLTFCGLFSFKISMATYCGASNFTMGLRFTSVKYIFAITIVL